MTIQPREAEARAYVDQYRNADGSPGNYRTDLIADLLEALDEARAESNRQQQFAKLLRRLRPWERAHRPVCVTMWSADDRGLVR